VAAAVKTGICPADRDIVVKLAGGDLTVRCGLDKITLAGEATHVFEGEFEY
jgi:diaminopimelate epimerase